MVPTLRGRFVSLETLVILLLLLAMVRLLAENRALRQTSTASLEHVLKAMPKNGLQQLHSFLYSSRFVGRTFPVISVRDVVSNEPYETSFEKPTIVILISRYGCSPCLKSELGLLQQFKQEYGDSLHFDVVGIGLGCDARELLILRKAASLGFTMYADESGLLEEWSGAEHFPLVLFVNTLQQVVACHYPIPGDPEFSKKNLEIVLRFLGGGDRTAVELPTSKRGGAP
jgi:hypothetical protein